MDGAAFRLAVVRGEVESAASLPGDPCWHDKDDGLMTCFHYAAQHNDEPMLRLLTQRSSGAALLSARNGRGNTPLHQAALSGCALSVRYIIELPEMSAADVNAVNTWLETPLHLACQANDARCIQLLQAYEGIALDARDKWGRTAADVLADHTAGRVQQAPAVVVVAPRVPAAGGIALSKLIEAPLDFDRFQALLAGGANVMGKDMFGLLALHKVAAWDHTQALELLLEHDGSAAHVNAGDKDGNTAAHHAALMGASRCLDMLVTHCAKHEIALSPNKSGQTALQLQQSL